MAGNQTERIWPEEMIRKLRQRPGPAVRAKLRQIDLSKRIGVEIRTIQQWENGERLPSAHNLQLLIQLFVVEQKFLRGSERAEAQLLWETVRRFHDDRSGNNRMYPLFDEQWFEAILAAASAGREADVHSGIRSAGLPAHRTDESPRSATAPYGATNLPSRMSSFIGRLEQVWEIRQHLADSPLVTLAGAGGSGKTRLAYKVASDACLSYPDGVWLFELASAMDTLSALRIITSVLGVKEQKERPLIESLLNHIRNKCMLLVFDNCEHLIDFCSSLIERLLSASPRVVILATSQEPLNIGMERVWRIPPLTFPTENELRDHASDDAILSRESVQLFIERATAVSPSFRVSEADVKIVGRICKRLEGIPLSIELAAARTNVLSIEQLDERLSDMFAVLTAGKRTAAPRHQSLRATLEWSFALLTEQERQLLRKLIAFTGGFELEAVEQICVDEESNPSLGRFDRQEALSLVASLFNKSFLSVDLASSGPRRRYAMLETIKQFGSEQWERHCTGEERERMIRRFVEHYCRFVERAERGFRSRDRDAAFVAIRREYANIRSALKLACDHPRAEAAIRMASCLYYYWLHEGTLQEGSAQLRAALATHSQTSVQEHAVKAKHGLSVLLWVMGEVQEAEDLARQSADEARKLGHPALLASQLRMLTQLASHSGLTDEAIRLAEESVLHARNSGDDWSLASSLGSLSYILVAQQQWERAEPLLVESATLFEKAKDDLELSGPFRALGYIALNRQKPREALALFKRGIAICQTYPGTWFLARGVEGLASALCGLGEYRAAATLIGVSEKLRANLGSAAQPQFQWIYEQAKRTCRLECGDAPFNEAIAIGRGMTREQAVSFALEV
ncbi:helix-turn-helix domain-containing protein [Paenibacillus alkalitolerans]|uniref:helix-turn-helix domain-containing protein n=1 Tax=Paenibacillus alkalitolerans TaxID=2799335 RepID=UPI0018F57391|nr:helix-turn-helix domain-containing protein [Paenibacillus alkalitolerans]